jgi:hypothetical protein
MTTTLHRIFVLLVLTVIALGGCGGDDDPGGSPGGGGGGTGVVARIEISPPGALFTPGASVQTFRAQAFDAANNPVQANVTWSSNAADVVAVASEGADSARATALKSLGSALVTAEAAGVKATVFAVAAEPAAGAVVLRDDQIVGLPTAVDTGKFGPGFRYKVDLVGVTAPVGAIVISSGAKTVAGRVVSAEGASVTVEQLKLSEVLPKLDIRQTLDLTQAPAASGGAKTQSRAGGIRPLIEKDFKIGPIDCKVEGAVGGFELAKQDFKLEPLNGLTYEIVWNDTDKNLVVTGEPRVTFELEPVVKGQIAGKVNCKAILREFIIPLPGVLGIFLGAAVPVGIGFELGATALVSKAGVNLKGDASAKVSFGFRCKAGDCTAVHDAESKGSLEATWIPPDFVLEDIRFEPTGEVFAFAKLEGGARFSSTLRFGAIDAQAGFKLEASLAREESQVKDTAYASSYKSSLAFSIGPADAVESFLKLLEVAVSLVKLEKVIPLATSPTGTSFKGGPASFKMGDNVTFDLAIDPKTAMFPVVGYNIESVRVYRKEQRPEGVALILANEVKPKAEETSFTIPWVATVDGETQGNFVAFIKTKVMDLRLEAGTSTSFGQITSPSGAVVFGATDGYSTIIPPGTEGQNPGSTPLAVGKLYFSTAPDGILVCAKKEEKGNTGHILLAFAKNTALVPGTYTFTSPNGPVVDGQFSAIVVGLGQACTEQYVDFVGGTLVLSAASATGAAGTVSLQSANGTSPGTFNLPMCTKTFAEQNPLSLTCLAP